MHEMLSSSEDDVIIRKSKPVKKRNLENLFDSSVSDDLSLIEDGSSERVYQPISRKKLIEYFGTGKEYFYCLEEQKELIEEVNQEIKQPRNLTEELLSFLVENLEIDYSVLKEAAQLLIDGSCVQFVALANPQFDLTIPICYKIYDLIEFYFSNPLLIEKLKKTGNFNFNFIPFVGKKELENNNLIYKIFVKNNALISKSKLKENLIQKKRVYAPEDLNDPPQVILEEFKNENISLRSAAQLIANEYFRDLHLKECIYEFIFNNLYLQINNKNYLIKEIKENCTYNFINELKEENYKIIYTLDFIKRIFINNNFESEWNEFREKVIDNFFIENSILKSRIRNYLLEISKTVLFENILDRIVNGRIKPNEFYISMAIESINLQVSVVNLYGELIEYKLINSKDLNSINELMEIYKVNELIFSGIKRNQIIKFLEKKLVYAEGSLVKIYSDSKTFTHNLVRMLISPETELAFMVNNNFCIKEAILSSIKPVTNESSKITLVTENDQLEINILFLIMLLTNKEANEVIIRAIQTGLSIVGVDINQLLTDKRKRELINYIPDFYFLDRIKEYTQIDSLELLQNIYSDELTITKINNFLTFLRCYKSDILDSFPIHPILYKKTRTLCAAAVDLEQTDVENKSKEVKMFLEQGGSINISHLKKELKSTFTFLKKVLEDKYSYFTGLPDRLVFDDLIPQLMPGVYEGSVFEAKERFLLVNIAGAICFVPLKNEALLKNESLKNEASLKNESLKKESPLKNESLKKEPGKYFINQLIKVKVIKKNLQRLTYEGEIYLESKDLPAELIYKEDKFYISKIKSVYYLTIHLTDTINYIIKILFDNKISVYEKIYDDIEELKLKFIKPLFINLKQLMNYPKYFPDELSALNSIESSKKVDYAFYLSVKYPGHVVFVYNYEGVKREYLKMTDKYLYDGRVFGSVDEFLRYRKGL